MLESHAPSDTRSPLEDRFWSKVQIGAADECWPWTGSRHPKGYGHFWLDGAPRRAHRVAWYLTYGDWPTHTIDHLCNTPGCQNVAHMEDVTSTENTRRRDERLGNPAARTDHCINGHEYTNGNLYVDRHGHRVCRACKRASTARYMERRRRVDS